MNCCPVFEAIAKIICAFVIAIKNFSRGIFVVINFPKVTATEVLAAVLDEALDIGRGIAEEEPNLVRE